MRRIILIASVIALAACDGKLTDEQRKKLNDGMKRQEIRRMTEAQLTDAAFAFGRELMKKESKVNFHNRQKKDSAGFRNRVEFKVLAAGDNSITGVEKEILDAYSAGGEQLADNVQKIGKDSILFTRPFFEELPDGSKQFIYAVGIKTSRKEIVFAQPK